MRLIIILLALFLTSCKKENKPETIQPETWTVLGETHHSKSVVRSMQYGGFGKDSLVRVLFLAADKDTHALSLSFTKPPQAGRTYRIVYAPDADNQVSVEHWSKISRGGGSQDEPEQYLKVSADGMKLRYRAVNIQVKQYTFVIDFMTNMSLNVSE